MDTVLRSRSKTVTIGAEQPFCIIGERINPTGRKTFAAELRGGALSTVAIDALAQVVVRAVGVEPAEAVGVASASVLGGPELRHLESLVANHVEQRDPAHDAAKEVRALRHGRSDEQAAVAAAHDAHAFAGREVGPDQPLGAGDEVVEDVLLVAQHAGPVPALSVLAATS